MSTNGAESCKITFADLSARSIILVEIAALWHCLYLGHILSPRSLQVRRKAAQMMGIYGNCNNEIELRHFSALPFDNQGTD